jgi:exonuclease-1
MLQLCRERHITYIVAPFEADAQIAFLQQNGFADIAISEDSDLLVYGCDQVCFFKPCQGAVYMQPD